MADDALTLLTVASGETKVNSLSRPLLAHNFTRPTFRFQITRAPKPVVRVEDLTARSRAVCAALQTAIERPARDLAAYLRDEVARYGKAVSEGAASCQ
jgi:hypothetical protein